MNEHRCYSSCLSDNTDYTLFSKLCECIVGESETGFLVLQPGGNATVTVTIFNSGREANFILNIATLASDNAFDFVDHFLDSPTVTVGSNSTVDFLVRLSVSENATDGLASTFTVIARSTLDESNDFVTFQLTVSTRPPPEFTENVSKTNWCIYNVDESVNTPSVCEN